VKNKPVLNAPVTKPFTDRPYSAPRWLVGRHSQTIWPSIIAPKPAVQYRRQRWETDDQDFIDVDIVDPPIDGNNGNDSSIHSNARSPTLVLFHGLEGSSQSAYAKALMAFAKSQQWRGMVAHFRGCSGENNRLMRAYHSGDSDHIDFVLRKTKRDFPDSPIYIVGVSLGGNAMLKWLGSSGSTANFVSAAFAISPPHDLEAGAMVLSHGFNRNYTQNFLKTLKEKTRQKAAQFPDEFSDMVDLKAMLASTSFFEFDQLVTAPVHGFRSCYDYWRRSSCKQFLSSITVPTTILNALNDPFQPTHALAVPKEISKSVRLLYTQQGGHVGFLQGAIPGHQQWLCKSAFSFFEENS
jgi:uncharacterized protein